MRLRKCQCGAYLFIRSFHTLLLIGITTTFVVKKTDVSDAIHSWPEIHSVLYTMGFFGLLVTSLIMYFTACLVVPGYVPLKKKKHVWDSDEEETTEHTTMLQIPQDEDGDVEKDEEVIMVKLRRCGFCEIEQPLRSHHCEDCGRCVRKYDHHCPWLETCVGERNHKFFWLFLISTAALVMWGVVIVWRAFVHCNYWSTWFITNAFFIFDAVVLVSGGFTVIGLAAFHTYLMCSNQTTWEVVSRERITYLKNLRHNLNPFHEGYCRNMYTFLCVMGAKKWDVLYKKYMPKKNVDS